MDDDYMAKWLKRQEQWEMHWRYGRKAPTLFETREDAVHFFVGIGLMVVAIILAIVWAMV